MKVHQHRNQPPAPYSTVEYSCPAVLPGILASLAGLGLFAIIAEAVVHLDRITEWDIRALQWLHSGTSPLGIEFFTAVSLFGAPLFSCLGLIVAVFLIRKQQWNYLAGWCVALIGGEILESVLKVPDSKTSPRKSSSLVGAFYVQSAEWSCHDLHDRLHHALVCSGDSRKPDRTWRIGIVATATLLTIGIGFSQGLSRSHYISDVAARSRRGPVGCFYAYLHDLP